MIYTQVSDELSFKDIESPLDYDIKSYNIIQPLGQGANGFVCKIEDFKSKECYVNNGFNEIYAINYYSTKNKQTVVRFLYFQYTSKAMKVVDKQRKDFTNIKKRLDKEILIQKELDHPNIIRLYKNFDDETNYYLILELGKDGDLKNFLNNYKPLSDNQILDFSYQLACGIKYLHDKDIVHRDLKLCNVLISNGIIKIADFGLATKVTDDSPQCNTICGTANYLSPEILNCEGYGKKIDIWSFGCILYALFTGSLPFFSGNPMQTIQNIKEGKWQLPNNISDYAKDLLQNTLNWDQNSRLTIEQVLSHKFYDKKHQLNMIIFNNNESSNISSNKLQTPTKTLLDWTSPRFNAPIFIPQKSQSSQKKNKKIHDLKSQKSLTSMKLDLNQYNKENQSNEVNRIQPLFNQGKQFNQNKDTSQNININNKPYLKPNVNLVKQTNTINMIQKNNQNKIDDNKSCNHKKSSLLSQNNQQIIGTSNIFQTTTRSIHIGENSMNLLNYQDKSMISKINENIEQQQNEFNPTQKLENYFQKESKDSNTQQQYNLIKCQNSSNIRNRLDQMNNNINHVQNNSQQNLKQNIEQKPLNFNCNQSKQNQNHLNQTLSNNQFTQSQHQINKNQQIHQTSPYRSQNDYYEQKKIEKPLKSYRSASSLHQNYLNNDQNYTQKNPLQQSKLDNNNTNLQQYENKIPKQQNQNIQKDLSRLPLHNIKKPLQYFSQQQQQQEYDNKENIDFQQSQNCKQQQNKEEHRSNSKKYSSLSTVTKPLNKQDESYIHKYYQNRNNQLNVQQSKQQNVNTLIQIQQIYNQSKQMNDQIQIKNQKMYFKDEQNILNTQQPYHINDQLIHQNNNQKKQIDNNKQFNLQIANKNIQTNIDSNQMKRNFSQQILPKDASEINISSSNKQKSINQTPQQISKNYISKNENNSSFISKKSQLDISNIEKNQIKNKNIRSLSSNNIIRHENKKDNLDLELLTTDRQLSGILRDQSERNLNFTKSPSQIQTRNNSKSFSQSVNGVIATLNDSKQSFAINNLHNKTN